MLLSVDRGPKLCSLLFAFCRSYFEKMFGRSKIDDLSNRFTVLQNVVGINLPRIATLENRTNDMDKKLANAERRLDRLLQRRNIVDDFNDHESWLGPVGPAAGEQNPKPSAPAIDPVNPFAMPSLTAQQADGAPMYTEEAGDFYGSGAVAKDPLNLGQIHGDSVEKEKDESWGQSLLPTPAGTPRRSPSPAPQRTEDEPIWGRQYLVFQRRIGDLEKQYAGLQALTDTLGKLVAEISDDDRIEIVTKYTTQFEDDLKTAKTHAIDALDTSDLNKQNIKETKIIAVDAREKAEQNQVLTQTIDRRLSDLERLFKQMPQTKQTLPAPAAPWGCDADGLLPEAAPQAAPATAPTEPTVQQPLAPKFGLEDADPWHQPSGLPDPWQPQPSVQTNHFQVFGQRGPGSPPGIRHAQHAAPTLGFSLNSGSAGVPSTPYAPAFAQQFSSPLGAAIHSQPIGQPLETIPIEPFDKTIWKIGTKDFPQDIQKFDGHTPAYKKWWNRLRDHISSCYQPWLRLLDLVERSRVPLTFKCLSTYNTVDGANLDLVWLSKELWSFLGPRLGEAVYNSRVQKAGG